jgi:hypothetical protein
MCQIVVKGGNVPKLCPDCEKDVPDGATECPSCKLDLGAFDSFDRLQTAREKKQERERKEREKKEKEGQQIDQSKPSVLDSWGLRRKKKDA